MEDNLITIKGTIIYVGATRRGASAKGEWAAREYVIEEETNTEYKPNRLAFEVYGEERINKFNLKVGDFVLIKVKTDTMELNGRWRNLIRCWYVSR